MQKLEGKTFNVAKNNIEKLKQLFPEVLTENKIDIDKLRLALGESVEKEKERYEFTWNGKTEAIQLAQKQTTGTLLPCKQESEKWNSTQNLYIEGDNLEVLRILQNSYRNKVKMIYIDPPYNTGKDFVYKDDFNDNVKSYKLRMNDAMKSNAETNGRYHTDWLNMMYPRLKIARNLLREDGAIFISIDDHELSNLYKICSEVFGESNFIEKLVWKRRATPPNDRVIGKNHEYILVFAKNIENVELNLQPRSEELNSRYKNPDNDPRGKWVASDLSANGKGGRLVESCVFPIINPETNEEFNPPPNKCWLYNKEKIDLLMEEGRIGFRENSGAPFLKRYLSEVRQGSTLPTILDDAGFSSDSAKEIKSLFKKDVFEFTKPLTLMKKLIRTGLGEEGIILDFFAGSSTTAHAVLELNREDNGNRKFIMVQIPEPTDTKSEAYKAGYKNLCEIGKDRIRLAATKLTKEKGLSEKSWDTGFKVFKLDETNLKLWDEESINIEKSLLDIAEPLKEGRTKEDVVYEILLKYGIDLSVPIEEVSIAGQTVFSVGLGYLFICLERELTLNQIEEMAKQQPARIVFYDEGFKDDTVRTNAQQILKRYGVEDIRVI